MQPGCNNHLKKKKKSLLFGKCELFVDMSSFDTNVLSEKVPEFSMAFGQEKRGLKWKEPDEIWKELAYPLYVKKNAQEEPRNMYQEWEWELKFVVCE